MSSVFNHRLHLLQARHDQLLHRPNEKEAVGNGIFDRYQHPVLTAAHAPLTWKYDLNPATNPFLMERIGINATLNAGAIKWQGKYVLVVRVEGNDRKSFFAVAESENGVDNFRFWDRPITLPETEEPDTNVYDMRLVAHEDGWVYGLFCTERRDPSAPDADQSAALAKCGIARTKDLVAWERLPDLTTGSAQQRNVVLHPEFVDGQYAFYTRPQDGFIDAGKGGGIGFGLSESINPARVMQEVIIDKKQYHTIAEVKNGLGPGPIKTEQGWLHLAHGVRNTAAGLRYVLYLFLTDLHRPDPHHPQAGRLLPGPGRRGAGRRRVERGLWQRLDCRRRRPGVHLLRLVRHPHARGHLDHCAAARLRGEYARRWPALGAVGAGD